jgi:Repeat of unknown function (DUF5648)
MAIKLRNWALACGCLAVVMASPRLVEADPLYRLWLSTGGDHFYTTSLDEAFNATTLGYVFEGNEGDCDLEASAATTPLYRLYSSSGVDHFYTTDWRERDLAMSAHGYESEGVACWVRSSQEPGTCPLYRMYSVDGIDHFYTLSWNEVLYAASLGYAYEGVAAYMGSPGGCPG